MRRLICLSFLLLSLSLQFISRAQSYSEDVITRRLTLITDSIEKYSSNSDYKKLLSVCENGIRFLSKNNKFYTSSTCNMCNVAGNTCAKLKDYAKAKFYYYEAIVADEIGKCGVGISSKIIKNCRIDSHMIPFANLLDFTNQDYKRMELLCSHPENLSKFLKNIAIKYWDNDDYQNACDFFEMEIALLEGMGDTGNEKYFSIFPLDINCLYYLKKYNESIEKADYFISLAKLWKGEISLTYAKALETKASILINIRRAAESVSLYSNALSIYEDIKGKENMSYIKCLRFLGLAYQKRDDNLIEQRKCLEVADSLLVLAKDASLDDKTFNASQMADMYDLLGENHKCIEYRKKSIQYIEDAGQTNSIQYAMCLSSLCLELTKINSYDEAFAYGNRSVEIYSQVCRTNRDSLSYITSLGNLANAYFESGDINKAISFQEKVLTSGFTDSPQKLTEIYNLINFYNRAKMNDKVDELCQMALKMAINLEGKNSPLYAEALMYTSSTQKTVGDKILMLKEASTIYEKTYGRASKGFVDCQQAISLLERQTLNSEDLSYELQAIQNNQKLQYGENSRAFYTSYFHKIDYTCSHAYDYGDTISMIKILTDAETVLSKVQEKYGINDDIYINAESILASNYGLLFNRAHDKRFLSVGVSYQEDVVNKCRKMYGEKNIKFIRTIEQLANIKSKYFLYYNEADSLQKIAINYYKNEYGTRNKNYISAIGMLASYYLSELEIHPYAFGKKFNNDSFLKEDIKNNFYSKLYNAIEIFKETFTYYESIDDYEHCSQQQIYLGICYNYLEDSQKVENCRKEGFAFWKKGKIQEFSMLASEEKAHQVNSIDWLRAIYLYTSDALKDDYSPVYAEVAYDTRLFENGLLLSSELGLRELITESNDSRSLERFSRLEQLKKNISEANSDNDKHVLRQQYLNEERLLMKESQQYGDYMHKLSVSFKDVKSCLKDKDIAIEFADNLVYDTISKDFRQDFYALTLKRDYASPRVTRLCSADDLKNTDSLYYVIWQPLQQELDGTENVFFAPFLGLNNLPIESAVLPDGRIISETGRRFFRLSSTRELVLNHEKRTYNRAVLYGGLEYNTEIEKLVASDKYERANGLRGATGSTSSILDINEDARKSLSVWNTLEWSRVEGDAIYGIMTKNSIPCVYYTKEQGTESTFKNLSGRKINLLHIATHGFYLKQREHQSEDEILQRSGLVFAGANHVKRGEKLPDGVDDGILTAAEISRLDLRGLDLVTLSACETGLGDVSSQGVYGLQRGFKKAGANSIVMSLWPVSDPATQLLMSEFYKNLVNGDLKYDALEKAKKAVKNYDNGQWANPKFWAAFILLDGLN